MLFLHFMNRELHESLEISPDAKMCNDVLALASLALDETLACNISQLIEYTYGFSQSEVSELIELNRLGIVEFDSSFPTFEEFIDSRSAYYAHDLDRYPMYARAPQLNLLFRQTLIHDIPQRSSVTGSIETKMLALAREQSLATTMVSPNDLKLLKQNEQAILKAVLDRDSAAFTIALFAARKIAFARPVDRFSVRRAITAAYIDHYLKEWDADIITGIPRVSYYDRASSTNALRYNYHFQKWTLGATGLLGQFRIEDRLSLIRCGEARFLDTHPQLAASFRELSQGLDSLAGSKSVRPHNRAQWAITFIARHFPELSRHDVSSSLADSLGKAAVRVRALSASLCAASTVYAEAIEKLERPKMTHVLIMTATDLEDRVLYELLESEGAIVLDFRTDSISSITEVRGPIGIKIFHVRSSAGSSGPSGAQEVANDAIRDVRPNFVMSVGICFGLQEKKQRLGDVVVSDAVKFYEPGKLQDRPDRRFKSRGPKVPAGATLLDRARVVLRSWEGSDVHTGLVASGEKLVDDKEFCEFLLQQEPEAVGGEMEGAGIVSASHRRRVEWIVIKGIADWGYGKEEKQQELAARQAIGFSLQIPKLLRGAGLVK
jgi:nucleoside phosphorylase